MRISDWSSDVCSSDLKKGRSDPIRLAGKRQVFARPAGNALCFRIDKGQAAARSQAVERRGQEVQLDLGIQLNTLHLGAVGVDCGGDLRVRQVAACEGKIGRAHV